MEWQADIYFMKQYCLYYEKVILLLYNVVVKEKIKVIYYYMNSASEGIKLK